MELNTVDGIVVGFEGVNKLTSLAVGGDGSDSQVTRKLFAGVGSQGNVGAVVVVQGRFGFSIIQQDIGHLAEHSAVLGSHIDGVRARVRVINL